MRKTHENVRERTRMCIPYLLLSIFCIIKKKWMMKETMFSKKDRI